ncbi:hypothetical protein NQ318_020385, partial [Aromia moschata]
MDQRMLCITVLHLDGWRHHSLQIDGPKLLIFDGHNSHIILPLIDMAIKHNIELLCLPSHTSHVLQPLDVGVFKPTKTAWRNVLKSFYQESGFKNVDKVLFPSLLKKLQETGCFSRSNAIGGFEGSGIYTLTKDKILQKSISSTLLSSSEKQMQPSTSMEEIENKMSGPDFVGFSQTSPSSSPKPQELEDITPTKKLELSLILRRKFAETLTAAEVRQRMIYDELKIRESNTTEEAMQVEVTNQKIDENSWLLVIFSDSRGQVINNEDCIHYVRRVLE